MQLEAMGWRCRLVSSAIRDSLQRCPEGTPHSCSAVCSRADETSVCFCPRIWYNVTASGWVLSARDIVLCKRIASVRGYSSISLPADGSCPRMTIGKIDLRFRFNMCSYVPSLTPFSSQIVWRARDSRHDAKERTLSGTSPTDPAR